MRTRFALYPSGRWSMEEIKDFNLWTFAMSAEFYEGLLGIDWIKERLARRDAELSKNRYALFRQRLEEHPVIAWWPWRRDQPWRSAKGLPVSQFHALKFNAPAYHIQLARGRKGFAERASRKRLRNRTDFESFAFECKVASMYYLPGYDVEFLPESRAHEPTPDFAIRSKGGKTYAECKLREYSKQWREYNRRAIEIAEVLLLLMDQTKTNLSVSVRSSDALQSLNERELTLELTSDLSKSGDTGSFTVGASIITWKNSGGFGVLKEGPFVPDLEPNQPIILDATETGNDNGKPVHMNPRLLSFSTTADIDRVSPLLGIYTNALRQIESHPPSILYIEVEEGTSGDVENYGADNHVLATFNPGNGTYDPRSGSLKYLIFTAIWLEMKNGIWSRPTRAHAIPNGHSKVVFPDGFLKAGKFFPGNANAEVLEKEAKTLIEKHDLKGALECIDFGLLHGVGLDLLNLKASVLNDLGNFRVALQVSSQVIAFDPKNAGGWVNRSVSLLGLNDLPEALNSTSHALGLDPNHVQAWCIQGMVYFQMGRRKEARQCLDMARSLNPAQRCVDGLARLLGE